MRDVPRQEFRWINSPRLTKWLCTAVQIGDPADEVIRMLGGRSDGQMFCRSSWISWFPNPGPVQQPYMMSLFCTRGQSHKTSQNMGNHWKVLS